MKNQFLENVSIILILFGGICLGLVGAFQFYLLDSIFSTEGMGMSPITRAIYVLIGLSAVYRIVRWAQQKKK